MNKINKLIGAAMIGAPLLMLLADTNSLLFKYPKNFWFTSILLFLSFYAFLGLIHGVHHLSNATKLALIGTLIASFGVLVGETIMGLERVAWAMNEVGLSAEIDRTVHHPIVFSTSRQIGLTFPIGLIILSIALFKAKTISMVTMAILIIGIILFPIGRIIVGPSANIAGDLIMLIIYGKLGLGVMKNSK
ncbi:MAG: hypothetical protein IPO86_09060 [Saprospiraceae bacterium]|nr:hypothetical protein [Saprospiraceae bacterium]MBK9728251.1 hypothetical protein [Saprospiraceae bacterium]